MNMEKGYYDIGLTEVDRPEDARERYGESNILTLEEEGKNKYSYEDQLIKIIWLPTAKQFNFVLENKSDHSIKIIWDEAVYVDGNGSSEKVMHSGVKFSEKNNSQPATVVVKNAKIDDLIMPSKNVYYVSGQYGGWRTLPLFSNPSTDNIEISSSVGKEVRILLPLEIENTVNEYIFSFKVNDFVKI